MNKARAMHPTFGPVCLLHAYHQERSHDLAVRAQVRLSREEYLALQFRANHEGCSVSEILRSALTGRNHRPVPGPVIDLQVYGQLARIGTNLNQIARRVNLLVNLGETPREIAAVALGFGKELAELRDLLKDVQSELAARSREDES